MFFPRELFPDSSNMAEVKQEAAQPATEAGKDRVIFLTEEEASVPSKVGTSQYHTRTSPLGLV
jgi:hypothetical protein